MEREHAPGDKVAPVCVVGLKKIRIGDLTDFRKGNELLVLTQIDELAVYATDGTVVTCCWWVRVVREDIDNVVSGIPAHHKSDGTNKRFNAPVGGNRVPVPNKVVKLMMVRKAIIHDPPESLY